MTFFLHHPDLIGIATLSAAVALAMALFAAARMSRLIEREVNVEGTGKATMTPQFAFSLSRLITIWSGICCGLAVVQTWSWKVDFFGEHHSLLEQLLVGGAAVTLLGLVNDAFSLRRHQLIAGQCLTALLLTSSGFAVRQVTHPDWVFTLGVFGIPATILWTVLMLNAPRLLRKSTGFAIIDGILLIATILVYSASQHYLSVALWCCLLCGSLTGLLVFNAPRWRAPLGPTGTMLISVQASVLAVHTASTGPQQIEYLAAVIFIVTPLVVLLIHLVKKTMLHSTRTASIPNGVKESPNKAVVRRPIQTPRTHRSTPARPLAGNLVSSLPAKTELAVDESGILKVSGTRNWAPLWETLCALGKEYDLSEFELQIIIPTLNEAYHARKRRYKHREKDPLWRMETPLYVGERHVGKLLLAGMSCREPHMQWMRRVASGMRPFEIHLLAVMESHTHLPTQLIAPPPLELRMLTGHDGHEVTGSTETDGQAPIVGRDEFDADRFVTVRMAN